MYCMVCINVCLLIILVLNLIDVKVKFVFILIWGFYVWIVKKVLDKIGILYIINGLFDIELYKKFYIVRILCYKKILELNIYF